MYVGFKLRKHCKMYKDFKLRKHCKMYKDFKLRKHYKMYITNLRLGRAVENRIIVGVDMRRNGLRLLVTTRRDNPGLHRTWLVPDRIIFGTVRLLRLPPVSTGSGIRGIRCVGRQLGGVVTFQEVAVSGGCIGIWCGMIVGYVLRICVVAVPWW
jgi:hypothetical protein